MPTIFDSHIHLFRTGFGGDSAPGAEQKEYDALRAAHGIHRALVIGFEGDAAFAGNNDYVLSLAETAPWMSVLPYVSADSGDDVHRMRERAAGVAIYPHSGVSQQFWRAVAQTQAVVSINVPATEIAAVLADADGDGGPILLSHLGLPGALGDISTVAEAMRPVIAAAAHPRVSIKLSGLYAADPSQSTPALRAAVDMVMESFGPGRMCWGSDYSPSLQTLTAVEAFAIPEWLDSHLTTDERDAIRGGTLEQILGANT